MEFYVETKPEYTHDACKLLNILSLIAEKTLAENHLLNMRGAQRRYPLFTPTQRWRFGGGIEDDHIPFLHRG